MKIVNDTIASVKKFNELKVGDVFVADCRSGIYMKIHPVFCGAEINDLKELSNNIQTPTEFQENFQSNVVNLNDNDIEYFEPLEPVTILKAELHISE